MDFETETGKILNIEFSSKQNCFETSTVIIIFYNILPKNFHLPNVAKKKLVKSNFQFFFEKIFVQHFLKLRQEKAEIMVPLLCQKHNLLFPNESYKKLSKLHFVGEKLSFLMILINLRKIQCVVCSDIST